jgi:HSP20 family molecular chaperone IbpA
MSSFLDKLKGKIDEEAIETSAKESQEEGKEKQQPAGYLQLDVDIYQTAEEIVIFALMPGVEIQALDITIENENDVITIQGKRDQPITGHGEDEIKYLRHELQWGQFYRQIILPQEINVSEVEAKLNKGILILRLPLLRLQTKGKKKIAVKT